MATLTEKFHRPENWEKCGEGTGYVMYGGGNDWEACDTALWVVFSSDEGNRRIWFKIKFPDGCNPGAESSRKDEDEKCKKHAEKARQTWARIAREAHQNRNHGSRSWKDAFKTAIHSKEMKPFVDEHGEEATNWSDVKEARARDIVNTMLESEVDLEAEA